MQKEDFDSQVQMVVERLYEDETLRGDLIDEEAEALLGWASQTLITQLDKTFAKGGSDKELEAAPEKEYARVKSVAQSIIEVTRDKPAQATAAPAKPEQPPKKTYTELSYTPLTEAKPATSPEKHKPKEGPEYAAKEHKPEAKPDPVLASFEEYGLSHTQVETMQGKFAGKSRLDKINLVTELLNSIN